MKFAAQNRGRSAEDVMGTYLERINVEEEVEALLPGIIEIYEVLSSGGY